MQPRSVAEIGKKLRKLFKSHAADIARNQFLRLPASALSDAEYLCDKVEDLTLTAEQAAEFELVRARVRDLNKHAGGLLRDDREDRDNGGEGKSLTIAGVFLQEMLWMVRLLDKAPELEAKTEAA